MGGTHFVKLGLQLAHIPLHFLYGGSIGTDKKKKPLNIRQVFTR